MNESLMPKIIRIATRKSPLALWQATRVSELLKKIDNSINVELVKITTSGDKILEKPLYNIGGKSLFLKELEQSLLDKDCHIAVHSMKDMPAELHKDLIISAILEREDSRDVLICKKFNSLLEFTKNSTIGTSSIRRICNLKYEYPNIQITDMRGNIDTRIKKIDNNEIDGIILAAAGVKRLGLEKYITSYMNKEVWIPAIGQGAIGIESRKDNLIINNLINKLNHKLTSLCVNAEREVSKFFEASCSTPIAANAIINNNKIVISSMIGSIDGNKKIYHKENGLVEDSQKIGREVAIGLERKGARKLL
ncbi:MAG: hydroxymethylbilane synthase [Gammaproteobacteria bacterium]|jgi:hydroxymethylbilane synthase|nr:hydroxymethylbilane synthase [Gammaproteobacteria bacterium]MBT7603626.1 hydroxymethylbilane synthase [Gammaproteobacteria bacterium]